MIGRTLLCDETLSSSGQTDHDYADLGVLDLDAGTVSLPVWACQLHSCDSSGMIEEREIN
jgi:hypothetical protein